jgi:hypothetical protein
MAVKLNVPANSTTMIIAVLKISSYEIIAAELLSEPRKAYLELPDQPANKIPYIPKLDKAKVYSNPKEKSNKAKPCPNGITAQPNKLNTKVLIGAK